MLAFGFHDGARLLGFRFGIELSLLDTGLRDLLGGFRSAVGFRFRFITFGVGFGDFDSGLVFALCRSGVRLFDGDTACTVGFGFTGGRLGVRFRDGDAAFAIRFRFTGGGFGLRLGDGDTFRFLRFGGTNTTFTGFFRNIDLRLVDGACGGTFTDGDDVSGFIRNIRDINVQEDKTDFLQFFCDVRFDGAEECFAIRVDLFNHHGCNNKTQLTEDDIFGKFGDGFRALPEQTFGGVTHDFWLRGDTDREDGRDVDSDVLFTQRVVQIDGDLQRP